MSHLDDHYLRGSKKHRFYRSPAEIRTKPDLRIQGDGESSGVVCGFKFTTTRLGITPT